MKSRIIILIASVLPLINSAVAQTSAFTYQGRLTLNGAPPNGYYDFMFRLLNDPTNGVAAPVIPINPAVLVSNGLFTTAMDFGATNVDGTNLWLEISVRTNGGGGFTTLAPRQLLTSAPYAIRSANASLATLATSATVANSANSVSAAHVTGTLALSQLPAAVVTDGESGVTLSGTFSGNGAGLVNVPGAVPSQIVSGTGVQAQPNVNYVANNPAQVSVTLPTNANVGDVVQVAGMGAGGWIVQAGSGQFINGYSSGTLWTPRDTNRFWTSVASSADGNKLVAVAANDRIYTSIDGGTNWNARASTNLWFSVASSSDGTKLVATAGGGQIYTSTDSGTSWTPRDINRNWTIVASSSDGTRLVATVNNGQLFTSTDSGANWTARATNRPWIGVASSSDGSKLVAVAAPDQIYTSTDSGTNWTPRASTNFWYSVASSSDGSKLVAGTIGGQIFTSTDGGTNWIPRESNRSWYSVASSADGNNLVAAVNGGQIYLSTNSGAIWVPLDVNRSWNCVASSSDGSKLAGVASGGQVYTYNTLTAYLPIPLAGGQGDTVQLQYTGNGLWQKLAEPTASNVALLNADQTFTGQNTFSNSLVGGGVTIDATAAAGAFNLKTTNGIRGSFGLATVAGNYSGQAAVGDVVLRAAGSAKLLLQAGSTNAAISIIPGNFVGIGKTNPVTTLDVNGTLTSTAVGIGTNSPATPLHVVSAGDAEISVQSSDPGGRRWTLQSSGASAPNLAASLQLIDRTAGASRLLIDTNGNVGIGTSGPTNRLHVNGGATFSSGSAGANQSVVWSPGSASWNFTSDRSTKDRVEPVDAASVLERLARVPIAEWSYIGFEQRHMGPMAQDFHAQFPLNPDDKSLNDADLHGVALAAIQGLNEKVENGKQKAESRIQKLETENAELRARLDKLERLLQKK